MRWPTFRRRPDPAPPPVEPASPGVERGRLRRIAAEALILQDEAEAVIRSAHSREQLGVVAPRGGPLIPRFFALRDALDAPCRDPDAERLRVTLRAVLDHHGRAVAVVLELLAYEWRSPRLAEQLDRVVGLGEPAARLESIFVELRH